ncbi:MAG: alpha/beta fold hydrolase [Acidimicrobiia bacterium]
MRLWPGFMTRRRAIVVAVTVVVVLLAFPVVRDRMQAGAAVLETFGVAVPRPFAPDPAPETAVIGGVTGRLYAVEDGQAILVIPGATPQGVEDSRVNDVARSLTRSGRTVFIPEMELYRERFAIEDLERIVAAVVGLAERSNEPVTVLGFSYGGSFALVAAADPRMEGRLSRVATLGAYYDLVGVIQAVTTGGSLIGDEFIPWEGHPIARDFLTARTAELLPDNQRDALMEAVEGRVDPDDLAPDARALYDLLVNTDPRQVAQLVERLPAEFRTVIDEFSPSAIADRITVPVFAMHSTDDPLVPYAELARLEAGMPQARTSKVHLLRHVDFEPMSAAGWRDALPDLLQLWNFTSWILDG